MPDNSYNQTSKSAKQYSKGSSIYLCLDSLKPRRAISVSQDESPTHLYSAQSHREDEDNSPSHCHSHVNKKRVSKSNRVDSSSPPKCYLTPERVGLTGKKPKTKIESPMIWRNIPATVKIVSLVQVISVDISRSGERTWKPKREGMIVRRKSNKMGFYKLGPLKSPLWFCFLSSLSLLFDSWKSVREYWVGVCWGLKIAKRLGALLLRLRGWEGHESTRKEKTLTLWPSRVRTLCHVRLLLFSFQNTNHSKRSDRLKRFSFCYALVSCEHQHHHLYGKRLNYNLSNFCLFIHQVFVV